MKDNALQFDVLKSARDPANKRSDAAHAGALIEFAMAAVDTNADYILKGIIDPFSLALIFGASGSGKTFAALDLGLHIAAGLPWQGRRVKKGGVLYVAAEAGRSAEKRIVAWRQHYSIPSADFVLLTEAFNLLDEVDVNTLILRCRDARRLMGGTELALVVIDTLSRCLSGAEENESRTMTAAVTALDKIRSATGAAVLAVHHTGKDPEKGARGHSSLFAACDTVLKVAEHTLTIEKRRDGIDGEKFGFTLEPVELGRDGDGDPLTTCVIKPADPLETAGERLSGEERGWLRDLIELFADPEAQGLKRLRPERGMQQVWCATRDQVRDWLRKRGRIAVAGSTPPLQGRCTPSVAPVAPSAGLSATDRSRLTRYLGRLKDKGKIGISDDCIWLITP